MTGRLIGLGGRLRAGKDAVGDYLVENKNFVKLGMSDALNDALQRIGPEGPWIRLDFPVIANHPWEHGRRRGRFHAGEYIRYRELLDAVGYVEAKKHDDVREYLQGLGTEVGREMIHPDVWVDIAKKRIQEHWDAGQSVVITAIRFPNEIDMLRDLGGYAVWVERPQEARTEALASGGVLVPDTDAKPVYEAHSASDKGLHAHASEHSVTADMFDYVLNNDGTLEQLHRKVEKRLDDWHPGSADYWQEMSRLAEIPQGWPAYDR